MSPATPAFNAFVASTIVASPRTSLHNMPQPRYGPGREETADPHHRRTLQTAREITLAEHHTTETKTTHTLLVSFYTPDLPVSFLAFCLTGNVAQALKGPTTKPEPRTTKPNLHLRIESYSVRENAAKIHNSRTRTPNPQRPS
jgi:hypothetical protein